MSFPTDFCPVCQHKMKFSIEKEIGISRMPPYSLGSERIETRYCPRNALTVKLLNSKGEEQGDREVYHYTHRQYPEGILVEIILHPYMIRHCPAVNKTRLFHLPDGDLPPKLIVQTSLMKNLDYSKPEEVINKLKKLILFS